MKFDSSGQHVNVSNTSVYDQIPAELHTSYQSELCFVSMLIYFNMVNIIPATHCEYDPLELQYKL